jgi:hypothetical protein
MEVETMEKEERVERMNRRKNAWIAKRICKDIISDNKFRFVVVTKC